MNTYWLIYKNNKKDSAKNRRIKPFRSYEAAELWAVQNNKYILGIAEKYKYDKRNILREIALTKDAIEDISHLLSSNEVINRLNNIKEIVEEQE